jgi:hypothetical protein
MLWAAAWGGPAAADVGRESSLSEFVAIEEQFEQDNRARESVEQHAAIARSEFNRGERRAALVRLKQALETAGQIRGIRTRTVALAHIAATQALVGDTRGALQTAGSIESLTERDSTLRIMALDRAKFGDFASARQFTDAIQDNSKKSDATRYIETQESARALGF